jgi:hypothetical protein
MRVLGSLLLVLLTLGAPASAAPASPDDQAPTMRYVGIPSVVYLYSPGTGPRHPEEWVYLDLLAKNTRRLDNVRLTVDASDLAGIATWQDKGGLCPAEGLVLTCTQDVLTNGAERIGEFVTDADPDAQPGDTGVVRFRATADGMTPVEWSLPVVVGRPELEVGRIADQRRLRAGDSFEMPLRVVNRGDGTALGFIVFFSSEANLEFGRVGGSACHYYRNNRQLSGEAAYCAFDHPLAPGDAVRLSVPMRVESGPQLLYGAVSVSVEPAEAGHDYFFPRDYPVTGSGPLMQPVASGPPGRSHGYVDVRVITTGHADFAAFGDTVRGGPGVGDEVEVTVGVRNLGPSDLSLMDRPPAYHLEFEPPPGTTVIENPYPGEDDPWTCAPGEEGAETYDCRAYNDSFEVGRKHTFTFVLRIDEKVPGAAGRVRVLPNTGFWDVRDPDPRNDLAEVRLLGNGQASPTREPERSGDSDDGAPVWPWVVGGGLLAVLAGAVISRFAMSTTAE